MSDTNIGFVIIGRNEGERLVRCLDSLPQPADRVVYVDSGSTDGSIAMAEARGVHVVRLDTTRPFTAGRARNEGFAALHAAMPDLAFVQFVDGDCELDAGWIEKASAFLAGHPDVAIVCGRRRERFPERSVYNRICDREWDQPIGEADQCGGDTLVRVTAFTQVGGFTDALIAGEEPELCNRLRAASWKIWRIAAEMTLHDAAMTRFRQWWLRGVRAGFGYAQGRAATAGRAEQMYGQQLRRALLGACVIPLGIVAAAITITPFALGLFAAYPAQAVRIALRTGGRDRWSYGALMVLAMFSEFQGRVRFDLNVRRGGTKEAIVYK
ncbi:MAG: glycosyltransferase family A protein [Sphingomonadales bacterium]